MILYVRIGFTLLRKWADGGVCTSQAKLTGKTVIITGANTGIGKETALVLAERGARVILACRDILKGERAANDIIRETGNQNVVVKQLDLANLKTVRKFADDVINKESHLEILINNAGVMACPYWKTDDGFEMQFGVNHLGHFLLTNLLLDLLKKSSPSRIITVSSLAMETGQINFEDINSEKNYVPWVAYCQSKLANVLFTRELSKKLEGSGVTANSLHPGIVATELGRYMNQDHSIWKPVLMKILYFMIFKTSQQGAQTTICLALDETLTNTSGVYFSDCVPKEVPPQARDDDTAKKLWDISSEMVGL
uniref:Retinol dehydrogenase 13-like n=1 Tax=Saccoglossus kowalevskii TaxID=10224 RepID=A0ABM0MAI4_SACKO|nr:PREDICTED: retinol dehydrogenase 13-like [Saccoglossus kowalevskii]